MKSIFSPSDLDQMKQHGIPPQKALNQLKQFETGFPYIKLDHAATLGDGVVSLSKESFPELFEKWRQVQAQGRGMKFVPASGAASRMFQSLLSAGKNDETLEAFVQCLDKFAFYPALCEVIQKSGENLKTLVEEKKYDVIVDYLLREKGLNYSQFPKGLIAFHAYDEGARTPFEEHLVEALHYTCDQSGKARLHFTVVSDFLDLVKMHVEKAKDRYAENGESFEITFSVQKSATDTLAVDTQNQPLRDTHGKLVFRPGGHGALLENIQDSKGDIVFIKNIDNVVPDALKKETYDYKKALGGYLVEVQEQIFSFLRLLESPKIDAGKLDEIFRFMEERFFISYEPLIQSESLEEQRQFLFKQLNRPIRVCGMVKNEGEPGGGPFWVQDEKGALSLQIVESSQVDFQNEDQEKIWNSSTHFNPVDLVCGLLDYQGKTFNLQAFVNEQTGFISHKSKEGKTLKALELPGLWNGAMAYWNTLFVEVPIETFNPVKVVSDLLRKQHQGSA